MARPIKPRSSPRKARKVGEISVLSEEPPKTRYGTEKVLSIKQQRFVEAVTSPAVSTLKQAAIMAGYAPASAQKLAQQNMRNPWIRDTIARKKAAIAKYYEISPEFVIGGVVKLALESETEAVRLGAYKILGSYLGLEKAPTSAIQRYTDEELARELYTRLIDLRGWSKELALQGVRSRFPNLDFQEPQAGDQEDESGLELGSDTVD